MSTATNAPRVDGARLWEALEEMAKIGATAAGGCNRQALTADDARGRQLFRDWCEAAGCEVRTDAIGNLFARRPGSDPDAAPILVGSHLDTQPTGGRYDGVYGVLAGLEVIRTLNDLELSTRSPLEVAVWTNEEGVRFAPAMMGSGVWAGEFELETIYGVRDRDGISVRDALVESDALGDAAAEPFPIKAALELHIEQGPILEAEARQIGAVSGVQGMRWYDLELRGAACHAGPTPMAVRRDPMRPLCRFMEQAYAMAAATGPAARITFGDLSVSPGSRNTVPERARLAIDIRHPDQITLDGMDASLRALAAEHDCAAVSLQLTDVWHSPAVVFDPTCVAAVRQAAGSLGLEPLDMVSGAGHDSVYVSRVAPTGMIFIPCRDGLSHNEAESVTPKDVAVGASVLLGAVLTLDAG